MIRLVASLVCIALLVLMVAAYGLILAGAYKDFAEGRPFDPAKFGAMFSPLLYRKVLIAFIVAMGCAVFDIRAIVSHSEDDITSEFTPKSDPLGFAALRARRYVLPVFVLFYLCLFSRLTVGSQGTENFLGNFDSYIFIGLFAASRRPLNWSLNHVGIFITNSVTEFIEGFSGGSSGGGHKEGRE